MENNLISQKIIEITDEIDSKIINYRQDFHKYAETAWLEIRTSSIIAQALDNLGFDIKLGREIINKDSRMGLPSQEILDENYKRALNQGAIKKYAEKLKDGFTGVCGILKNGNGPVIALRFDIDALEINETNNLDHIPNIKKYSSINENSMHSCGHDTHASVGLGVAEVISKLKDKIKGTIKLIFQPAEEGVRGAKSIVDSGILDNVNFLFGHHIMCGYTKGEIMTCMGGYLATQKFDAVISGKSSHAGGNPQSGDNALLAASNAVINLYAIPRHSDGITRINVGKLNAGTGRNVICDKACLVIETRGQNNKLSDYMYNKAINILKTCSDMYNCKLKIISMGGALSGYSDRKLADIIENTIKKYLTNLKIISSDRNMGSEDFTYMMDKVQKNGGLAVNIGVGADIKDK
ncbi:MAG: amidohydrolase, partial [Candidatus Muirbacterium halophilum]|nr:amidohydrolase [Candidatus Muirbacterium halophilum]